jgi:5-methylthioadenosine/S-adenosylhomocysteine deaminase
MKRVLIKCGWLVTLDPAIGELKDGELLYRGNRIEAAGRNLDATADEVIDAGDKIVMPGLVNTHMHTWETALRGIAAEWMSADYFRHIHSNLATRYQPQDNYIANLMGALAQIDGGTTTLVDWCHNITTLEHAERAVDGLIDSGIRAVFAHGTAKPIGATSGTPFTHVPHPRERIEALRKGRLASDDGRVTLAMAILGPDWGTWEVVEHDIRMAREFGLVSSSHTRRREDCVVPGGYARMAKAGLLGPDHNLVHGTSYDGNDLRIVTDSGATLTSTVLVELHHHVGDTMVARYRAAGGMPSLGIDVEPYCSGQMLREMQAALLFTRGKEIRNNALRGNSPFKEFPVKSREALEWATIGGARAFRMEDRIGTLSPGKNADIVMLRADDINMVPVYDPIYSIVEIAGAGNVDTVIIDGVVRKKDGRLTFPADALRRRRDELAESGARIMHEGGYRVETNATPSPSSATASPPLPRAEASRSPAAAAPAALANAGRSL